MPAAPSETRAGALGSERSQPAPRAATVGYDLAMWGFRRPTPGTARPAEQVSPPEPAAVPHEPAKAEPDRSALATDATLLSGGRASSAPPRSPLEALADTQLAVPGQPPAPARPDGTAGVAEARTLDASSPEVAAPPALSQSMPDSGSARRSTVLPRVQIVGTEPRLVRDDRPRYEPTGLLGEGGVGEVLKAVDNDIGRTVAVKRLRPEMRAVPVLVRFADEIRTVGQLEHPNIVPIHDVGIDERGEYYFVMKYVDGETLESIIDKLAAGDARAHARFGFEQRVQVFLGILEAIHYAHARGIIHRDIKPANVMVGSYGEVMVMDWGIAKRIRGEGAPGLGVPFSGPPPAAGRDGGGGPAGRDASLFRTRDGALLGTPAYMSPEQARGEPLDERSDTYSLCVLLHELLGLRHYLADRRTLADMLAGVVSYSPPHLSFASYAHQPPPPADLAWFVKRGLEKDPAARFQSVADMIERLRRRADGDIPIQCPMTFARRATNLWARFIDRHPRLLVIGMTCTLAGAVVLAWTALR
jgi:serine/threonine-protein kinase